MKTVQFKDAKVKLSAVVDDAVAGEPTVLARDGKNEAVVISFDEYEKNYRKPTFGELLMVFRANTKIFRSVLADRCATSI